MQHLVPFPMELPWAARLELLERRRRVLFPSVLSLAALTVPLVNTSAFPELEETSPCWGLPGVCFRMKRRSVARRLSSPSSRWLTCLFPEVRSPSSQEEREVSAALQGQGSTLHKRWISKQLSAIGTV